MRAETGVKTAKRTLTDNTRSDGSPNWEKIHQAMLQYRNTPIAGLGASPSTLLFGRRIKDLLPVKLGKPNMMESWVECKEAREVGMRHRYHRGAERWSEHTRDLPSLELGQHVMVQNQRGAGKQAKKWDRTGIVVDCPGYDKYSIRMDGSGNVTDRNRKFLRAFAPDHQINPPSPHRPCMEQPDQTEVEPPPSGEGTLSSREVPFTTPQESNTPEAPQIQEAPQERAAPQPAPSTPERSARTPPSPEPERAAPQLATGHGAEAGSTPRRSARARRQTKRYITEC